MSGEPEAFDDHARSLARRKTRADTAPKAHHLRRADGLDPRRTHLRINSRLLRKASPPPTPKSGAAVGLHSRAEVVVEPGGAVGLRRCWPAASTPGQNVVIVLSGGMVDADLFAKLMLDSVVAV